MLPDAEQKRPHCIMNQPPLGRQWWVCHLQYVQPPANVLEWTARSSRGVRKYLKNAELAHLFIAWIVKSWMLALAAAVATPMQKEITCVLHRRLNCYLLLLKEDKEPCGCCSPHHHIIILFQLMRAKVLVASEVYPQNQKTGGWQQTPVSPFSPDTRLTMVLTPALYGTGSSLIIWAWHTAAKKVYIVDGVIACLTRNTTK